MPQSHLLRRHRGRGAQQYDSAVPGKIKESIARRVGPILGSQDWRPSRATPLHDGYLESTFGYDEEDEIKQAVRRVRENTMTSFERLATLWQQIRYLDRHDLEGSLVECGTWRGGAVGMMALAHMRSFPLPHRRIHLFDSFEGLPEPSRADGAKAARYSGGRVTGALDGIGICDAPLDDNRALLEGAIAYPSELISYHQGWFQETVPRAATDLDRVALLRLDGDWYESTMVCLKYLYPLVVDGGVVVVDDYGHWEGCRKAVDEFLAAETAPILLSHIDYTGRYWVKRSTSGVVTSGSSPGAHA